MLDFPVELDSSGMEIISEFVYANSSTMDGRRFAAEYAAKRKADAAFAGKPGARSVAGPSGKPVSIADGKWSFWIVLS